MENNFFNINKNSDDPLEKSSHAVMFFDENKNVIYINKIFLEKFELKNQDEILNKKPDFLIAAISGNIISFSSLPLEKILSEDEIFYFKNSNDSELVFKILIYKTETIINKTIYKALFVEITRLNDSLVERSIRSLLKASQLKDNDTGQHIQRINEYSFVLTEYLYNNHNSIFTEINPEFYLKIKKVASMHDVGKIGIPDFILTKPAKLTIKESKIMQEHTINGAFILSELAGHMARDIALFHHEKWNGSGYPYGLKEEEIPLSARIVAVADVYDALRMKRSYKISFTPEKTKKIIIDGRGSHFDPRLVDAFLEIENLFFDIYSQMADKE